MGDDDESIRSMDDYRRRFFPASVEPHQFDGIPQTAPTIATVDTRSAILAAPNGCDESTCLILISGRWRGRRHPPETTMSEPRCDRMVVKPGNHWPCICDRTPAHEDLHRCVCGHQWEDDSE